MFAYLFPQEKLRKKALTNLFTAMVKFQVKYGEVYGYGSPLKGIALWITPFKDQHESLVRLIKSGFLKIGWPPLVGRAIRAIKMMGKIEDMQKLYISEDHIYLELLAVDEKYRGQGISRKLLDPMIEKAKQNSYSIYLETSNPNNVGLYKHFGFTKKDTFHVDKKKLEVFPMIL